MAISPTTCSAVAKHAPAASSSSADRLVALKEQQTKLLAQLKATQNDKSLDTKAKEAKVAQLTAQKTQLDAQIQRLGSQQASTSTDAAASAAPDAGIHIVG